MICLIAVKYVEDGHSLENGIVGIVEVNSVMNITESINVNEKVNPELLKGNNNMDCTLLTKNNWCHIYTQDAKFPFEKLDDTLSFYVENYERTKEYKDGKWDGRCHRLYQKRYGYTFRTGLLNKVLLVLDVFDYPYQLTDDRNFAPPSRVEYQWNFNRPLWKHQIDSYLKGLEKKMGIFEIAMGGGKTIIMAKLIHDIGSTANCYCERRIIAHQNARVFQNVLGRCGFIGDNQFRPDKLNVIMLQTAYEAYIHLITADKTIKKQDVLPPNARIYKAKITKIKQDNKSVDQNTDHI